MAGNYGLPAFTPDCAANSKRRPMTAKEAKIRNPSWRGQDLHSTPMKAGARPKQAIAAHLYPEHTAKLRLELQEREESKYRAAHRGSADAKGVVNDLIGACTYYEAMSTPREQRQRNFRRLGKMPADSEYFVTPRRDLEGNTPALDTPR